MDPRLHAARWQQAPKPTPYIQRPASAAEPRQQVAAAGDQGQGRNAVPWGIPTEWQGRVIAELERFVTPTQFPAYLSPAKATDSSRSTGGRSAPAYHEANEKAARDRNAAE